MPRLFRIPEASALAFHAVLKLVDNTSRPVAARKLAEDLDVSEAHLAKVMKRLVRAGIVKSAFSTPPPAGDMNVRSERFSRT